MGGFDDAGAAFDQAVARVDDAVAGAFDAIGHRLQQIGLPRADAVGVAGDEVEAGCGQQVTEGARVTRFGEVERAVIRRYRQVHAAIGIHVPGIHQLHQTDVGLAVQILQVRYLERLDEHRCGSRVAVGGVQRADQLVLEVIRGEAVVRGLRIHVDRMLQFRVDAHALRLRQRDHFVQRRDFVQAVEALVAVGARLDGAQRLDFGQREGVGEVGGGRHAVKQSRGLAAGIEHAGHIGRAVEYRLVAGDQVTILRQHQIRFDEVRTLVNGERIRRQRVLRQVAGGAAVADDDGGGAVEGVPGEGRRCVEGGQQCDTQQGGTKRGQIFHECLSGRCGGFLRGAPGAARPGTQPALRRRAMTPVSARPASSMA